MSQLQPISRGVSDGHAELGAGGLSPWADERTQAGSDRGNGHPDRVPFVDLRWVHDSLEDEIASAISGVVARSDFILGGAVEEFETAFAGYVGAAHAVGVDSGFSALELALRALDVGHGDEVITAANTFVATVGAIEACGAIPVLVDVDPVTSNIDPELLPAAITQATKAIIPVHLYGRPAELDEIVGIAAEHGLLVVEDACQAHGAMYRGRRVGGLGDAAAFSFYPGKNLGALGDGGMVVTNDPDTAAKLRKLRNLGSTVKYRHEMKGFNRRLDTLHAAVLLAKLRHLDAHNELRRSASGQYRELLADVPVGLPTAPLDPEEHVYHLFVVETEERDGLQEHLGRQHIGTGVHYPVPIHQQPAYRSLASTCDFPVTERSAQRILSLPMYPGITSQSVQRTAAAVASFFSR